MIGKIIGNYQITSELAQGGMGAVYRGRHLHLPREVVVKSVLLGPFSPSDQAHLRARFRREALVQSQLDHPNIVRVIPGQAEKNAGHTYRRRFGDELALVSGGEEAIHEGVEAATILKSRETWACRRQYEHKKDERASAGNEARIPEAVPHTS